MIKAIVFDLDDTLLETQQTKFAALKYAGDKFYGQDITDETLKANWGKPFLEFIGLVFNQIELPEVIAQKYKSILPQFHNRAYQGTLQAINELSINYQLGIVSSASKSIILDDLDSANIPKEKFVFIQGSEDTPVHKPNPEVFNPIIKYLESLGTNSTEILYIGDMITDYQAASGAGLQFLGFANRTTTKAEFDEFGASTIESITDLNGYLKNLA